MELKAELERAVEKEEFAIRYQPLVEVATGRITGLEALVRWEHPTRGLVAPAEFISLAEETGLVLPIGTWILREACQHAKQWQDLSNNPDLTISVNLSPRQLQQSDLVSQVKQALALAKLDPSCLMLEITEHVLMEDLETTVPKLHELKEIGVRLAIDDFGTGYSSLSYLRTLPIHVLKIAKSFIDGVALDIEESALARAIIKLGATMNLETIAEGIESAEQWTELRILGCTMGQGFYLYHPMSEPDVRELLATNAMRQPALTLPL
jgi:EAL domain-containing protein (putative c-di-GMP-specific phosphodiesterase class I)